MLIRVAEGRVVSEAPFVLYTAAGGGGIAGSLVGGLNARARRDARLAEFVGDRKSEVFNRGESSGDGGFGLFFVDRMMEQYGGDIRVEDAALGGAVFVSEFQWAE